MINEPVPICFWANGSRAQHLAPKGRLENSGACSTTAVADPQLRLEPMKKLALVLFATFVLLLLALGTFTVIHAQRPAMPQQWSALRPGMTPEQVRSVISDEIYDLRAVQGFDVVTHMNKNGHWQLIVRYDSQGHVSKATARYIHTAGLGLLNSGARNLL